MVHQSIYILTFPTPAGGTERQFLGEFCGTPKLAPSTGMVVTAMWTLLQKNNPSAAAHVIYCSGKVVLPSLAGTMASN